MEELKGIPNYKMERDLILPGVEQAEIGDLGDSVVARRSWLFVVSFNIFFFIPVSYERENVHNSNLNNVVNEKNI